MYLLRRLRAPAGLVPGPALLLGGLVGVHTTALAQAPYIVGTWKLNVAASRLPPGPPPQVHVRRYSLAPDGTLVGLAVVVDSAGNPYFLQFAAKAERAGGGSELRAGGPRSTRRGGS